MKMKHNDKETINNGFIVPKFNIATANKYKSRIKVILQKYYTAVTEDAINAFIRTGDLARLTAQELLAGAAAQVLDLKKEKVAIAASFVSDLDNQANSVFRKSFKAAKKQLPPQLINNTPLTAEMQNLITNQVQKITSLEVEQYDKINNALQNAIVEKRTLPEVKKALRDLKIFDNEKRLLRVAYNQLHYANVMLYKTKAVSLGLDVAIWKHPPNAVYKTEPRPSHKEANGKQFNLQEGCKIDGEYIYPGQLINCKCYYIIVI